MNISAGCARSNFRGIAVSLLLALGLAGCGRAAKNEVVVYTSVDQEYAQEVFLLFTKQTGIRVLSVYDTEAGKTTGLYRRLLAEKDRPVADVFWNSELCRTIELAKAGATENIGERIPKDIPGRWVDAGGRWAAFSLRARVIVYNPKLVKAEDAPRTLEELTLEKWRGKVAMANPLFGTTASHVAALYEKLGEAKAEEFLKALKKNGVRLVEGNSVVRDMVARGEALVGITDSDDVFSGMLDKKDVDFVIPDQGGMGTFVIPNSVAIIRNAPHHGAAVAFTSFLLAPAVEELLARGSPRQAPVRENVPTPDDMKRLLKLKTMDVDYARVAERMAETATRVEKIFLQ